MMDRTNSDWLILLTTRDAAAVADLRDALCRGLVRVLAGRAEPSLAEDFAQDAVLQTSHRTPFFGFWTSSGRFGVTVGS